MHRDRWVEQWKFLLRQDVQYFGVKRKQTLLCELADGNGGK